MKEIKKMRIGVFGLTRGGVALKPFADSFEETELTAICDFNTELLEKYKKQYPDVKTYTDFDEFISSGLDGVVLVNYFHEHAEYAIRAMKKGVAVLSETTAAATLGECVDLVETAEATGAKYMLAANCLYFPAVHAMKAEIESGKHGKVLYGQAEYVHGHDGHPFTPAPVDLDNLHWRQTSPSCYYNMHTLGPLMYITNTVPVNVMCVPLYAPEFEKAVGRVRDCPNAMVITKMDNGAVFNTTGCAGHSPSNKWYRISCTETTLETERYNADETNLLIVGCGTNYKKETHGFVSSGVVEQKDYKPRDINIEGHGGIDYWVYYNFVKYLLGEKEPFLDVYRSAALSATGILAWYSALSDSKIYDVPDFHKKEERDAIRNDYRSPYAKKYSDLTLPCEITKKDEFKGLLK